MKKILLGCCMVFLALGLSAQLEIRPFAGFNFANVTESPDGTTTSAKVGWQFGGHLLVGKKFHLYPGISYFQQVTEYVFEGEEDITLDQTIAGVKIPILVGFRFMDPEEDPILNLRLFAGPALNFHTKNEYSEGFVDDEVDWNTVTWGARVGAGVDLFFLFVDIGYEFGLTNVHDVSDAAESFKDTKSNTFLINAGVKLAL